MYTIRFRWAVCQLDSLRNCLNLSGLRRALASLPKTLDDTYTRILCNIDEDHYQYASKILQWLTYSARPLKLEEVAEVIAIDVEENPRFDPGNRFPEPRDILMICSSLISLEVETLKDMDGSDDESDSVVVRLAHFSVKEYLVSKRILQGDAKRYNIQEINANIVILNGCLAYLLEFDGFDSLTSESLAEFPLAKYAAKYWTQHAQVVERDSSFNPLLTIELFLTEGHGLLNWIRLYDPERNEWQRLDLKRISSSICPPLYYASITGLQRSVQILLDKGANVNAQGGDYGNALQAASRWGYDQIVQILLDKGADVNAQGGRYGNALQAASRKGYDQVVRLLREHGAQES